MKVASPKTLVVAIGVMAISVAAINSPEEKTIRVSTPKPEPVQAQYLAVSAPYDGLLEAQAAYDAQQEAARKAAEEEAARVAAEEEAARQAAAEEAARQAEMARRTTPVPQGSSSPVQVQTGGCCGPHSDAWWQGVAVCEQGGRNDPYFGYFSFMDGSQGGKPWADQVAAGNALLARAGREVGPWAASCVAAGYNASPGG